MRRNNNITPVHNKREQCDDDDDVRRPYKQCCFIDCRLEEAVISLQSDKVLITTDCTSSSDIVNSARAVVALTLEIIVDEEEQTATTIRFMILT